MKELFLTCDLVNSKIWNFPHRRFTDSLYDYLSDSDYCSSSGSETDSIKVSNPTCTEVSDSGLTSFVESYNHKIKNGTVE